MFPENPCVRYSCHRPAAAAPRRVVVRTKLKGSREHRQPNHRVRVHRQMGTVLLDRGHRQYDQYPITVQRRDLPVVSLASSTDPEFVESPGLPFQRSGYNSP